jgi:integrase
MVAFVNRLRMPGRKAITIKGQFGSAEFADNYRTAVEGGTVERRIAGKPGSVAALARIYLASASFAKLRAPRMRRYFVEKIAATYGHCAIADLDHNLMRQIMRKHDKTPGNARNILSVFRILTELAIEQGFRKDDPTVGIKPPKLSKDGWHAWTEEEIATYEAHHQISTQARLALALALYTGQRASDLFRMGRQHVKDGRISVAQQKTGTRLWIPLHPDLKAIMDATPSEHLTFVTNEYGKPYASGKSLGNRMARWAKEAGLTKVPLHGLRKACCRRLAEAGCTVHQFKAISGHKSLAEVQRYTDAVSQTKMADQAIVRVIKTATRTTHTDDPNYPQEKKG